jgi:hypothetical protein
MASTNSSAIAKTMFFVVVGQFLRQFYFVIREIYATSKFLLLLFTINKP